MTVFTLLYAVLAVIAGWLTARHLKGGPPDEEQPSGRPEQLPVFTY